MSNDKKEVRGIGLDGILFKQDGTVITWEDFVDMVEGVGMVYVGKTIPLDEDGEQIKGKEVKF